ncbi:phage tail tape measure protein [Paenibacillus sp. GCM10027627]|uniref:phage tail tape measure protein n=1 Tax=unclassified Paenibacillus TaxID=185978 RepID=UPI00362500EC
MSEDLRILIRAGINVGKSIKEINESVKNLEKHPSLQKIKLKLDIDNKFTQSINKFIASVSKMKKIADEQSKAVIETQNVYRELDGTVKTVTETVLKNGEIVQKTKTVHDANKKAIQDETLAARKLTDEIEEMNTANLDSIKIDKNKSGRVTGYTIKETDGYETTTTRLQPDKETLVRQSVVENFKKQREDEIKLQEKYNKEEEKLQRDHFLALQQNKKKDIEFQQSIANKQAKINDLIRRFGADNETGEKLERSIEKLKSIKFIDTSDLNNVKNYKQSLADLDIELKNIIASANTSGSHIDKLNHGFSTAITKTLLWAGAMTSLYAPLHGLQAAIDTILTVNKQLVELKRVMDEGTNFDNLLQGSIDLANELGRSITEVNESLTGFARQGFNEQQILDLTKTATLAQNISDLKAGEAMDAITAAMVVFNIEADKSLGIVDAINNVDNNFAVTSQNLAVSLQKSASAAKTFGVSMEELIGDATTIMQIQRESGSVAGNSLKTIYSRLTTMQPAIDALSNIGINIHHSNGELKTATQILDEVAIAFKDVNEETKQNTAVALAG